MARVASIRGGRHDVLALCYHGTSETWPELTAIAAERLHVQLARLLRRGWMPATFTEAVLAPPAARTLTVTFDDAFLSTCRAAATVLSELGVPATIFVPTTFPDSGRSLSWPHLDRWLGTPHERELRSASWDDLRALADAGWEIGSHSVTHPRLTQLTDERLEAELTESRAEVERRLGRSCTSVAYPYGAVDDRVADAARAAGYTAGAALLPVQHRHDRLRFPRVFIASDEGDLLHLLHLRRGIRRLQGTGRWPGSTRSENHPRSGQ